MHGHCADILIAKGPIMSYVDNTGAFFGNKTCEARQAAGTVTDGSGEATKASIRGEAALDNTTEQVQIDITAAEREDHFLVLKLRNPTRQAGRQARSTGAFDDGFL